MMMLVLTRLLRFIICIYEHKDTRFDLQMNIGLIWKIYVSLYLLFFYLRRKISHPCTWIFLSSKGQGFYDSFSALLVLHSVSEIYRRVSLAGAFQNCHIGLSAIVTFNYSFSAFHQESASTGAKEVISNLPLVG